MPPPTVYISLTSIPTRVSRTLRRTLDTLVNQTHPIQRILVTIPTVNMRGQPAEGVDLRWLEQEYSHVVTIHRPDYDWGPVMKYVGCVKYVHEDQALVFVCDDDQEYASDRVTQLLHTWDKEEEQKKHQAVVGWVGRKGISAWHPRLNTLYGFRGVLVPIGAIRQLHTLLQERSLPRCCAMNDDVMASLSFLNTGYHIVDHSGQDDEFLNEVHEEEEDALHSAYKSRLHKFQDMLKCHWEFNRPFLVHTLVAMVLTLLSVCSLLVLGIYWIRR